MTTSTHTLDVKGLVRCAIFAALIAALGLLPQIPVPIIPVPITAQTLGVMLAGAVLGPKRGALAVLIFLGLVLLGFPMLSGGRGGLGVFFGPSAGFLFGWPVGAFVVGTIGGSALPRLMVACLIGGIGAVYLIGVPWMAAVAKLSIDQALISSLAFLPGDLIKAVLAAIIARGIHRGYPALRQ